MSETKKSETKKTAKMPYISEMRFSAEGFGIDQFFLNKNAKPLLYKRTLLLLKAALARSTLVLSVAFFGSGQENLYLYEVQLCVDPFEKTYILLVAMPQTGLVKILKYLCYIVKETSLPCSVIESYHVNSDFA